MEFSEMLSELKQKTSQIDFEKTQIVVWGMGHTTELYQNAFTEMRIVPYAYSESDTSSNFYYCGIRVIAPCQINELSNPFVIISAKNRGAVSDIEEKVGELGVPYLQIEEFFFSLGVDEILQNMEYLEDDFSKNLYKSLIIKRLQNIDDMRDEYIDNAYYVLPEFCRDDAKEVFVDAGGFVGDTLERYIWSRGGMFKKAFVFEPDRGNYSALQCRVERLKREWNYAEDKIVSVCAGLGEQTCTLKLKETAGAGSIYCKNGEGIHSQIYALDDYFADERITFIKADIESFELAMLRGSVKVLQRDRPKMAICIYHNSVDMYRIIQFIRSLNLGYRMKIRHHSVRDVDTVLYVF